MDQEDDTLGSFETARKAIVEMIVEKAHQRQQSRAPAPPPSLNVVTVRSIDSSGGQDSVDQQSRRCCASSQ